MTELRTESIDLEPVLASPDELAITPTPLSAEHEPSVLAKPDKTGKFRISSRTLFLTYSQVPTEATKDEVLHQLQSKLPFDHYVVGRELHKDGGAHFHVVLKTTKGKKFNIRNANMLDLVFDGATHHGNYCSARVINASIEYACKDGDYITNFDFVKNGKVLSTELLLAEKFHQQGRDATLLQHFVEMTKPAFGKLDIVSMDKMFTLLEAIEARRPKLTKSDFKIEDFNLCERLQGWVDSKEKQTLFLLGPSGVGKTQFVRAVADRLGWKMLTVNELQGLKALTPEHDSVFFDDFAFGKLQEDEVLALVESQYPKDIRILFKGITKKAGLAQIFAFNPESIVGLSWLRQERFLRRATLVGVPPDFAREINININLNVNINVGPSEAEPPVPVSERQARTRALIQANLEALDKALGKSPC